MNRSHGWVKESVERIVSLRPWHADDCFQTFQTGRLLSGPNETNGNLDGVDTLGHHRRALTLCSEQHGAENRNHARRCLAVPCTSYPVPCTVTDEEARELGA